jgi:hypothetical protein
MATVITDEQRIALRKEPRFEDMTRASVANYAQFIHDNDGVNPPGMSQVTWAKQRFFIAEPIVNHPDQADVQSWVAMFAMFCKGLPIWDTDVQGTINFMIANNTFETLASQSFGLRGANVNF